MGNVQVAIGLKGGDGHRRTSNSMAVKAVVWLLMFGLVAIIVQFFIPLQARDSHVGRR